MRAELSCALVMANQCNVMGNIGAARSKSACEITRGSVGIQNGYPCTISSGGNGILELGPLRQPHGGYLISIALARWRSLIPQSVAPLLEETSMNLGPARRSSRVATVFATSARNPSIRRTGTSNMLYRSHVAGATHWTTCCPRIHCATNERETDNGHRSR